MKDVFYRTRVVFLVLFLGSIGLGRMFGQGTPRESAVAAFRKTLTEFLATKDVAKAEQGFNECLKLDPSYAQPYYNLAVLAETKEDWTAASQDFAKYLELSPNAPNSAEIQSEIKDLKSLAENDSDPVKKKIRQYFRFIEAAKTLYDKRNYQAALERAQDAQKTDPDRWEGYAMAGRALFAIKRYRDAADSLRAAATKAPQEQRAKLQNLATKTDNEAEYQDLCRTAATQISQGQYSVAAAVLDSAWKLFPERTKTGFDAAANAILAKDYNTAKSILEELAKDPEAAAMAVSMLTKANLLVAVGSNQTETPTVTPTPVPENESVARTYVGEVKSAGNPSLAAIPCTVDLDPSGASGTIRFGSQVGDTTVRFSGDKLGDKLTARTGDVVSKPARIKWEAETFTLVFSTDGSSALYTCTLPGSDLSGTLSSR